MPTLRLAVLVLALAAAPAWAAGDQDFTLHNDTGKVITHVYVSEANNDHWEDDVLGRDVLEDGEMTKVTFDGYDADACSFDVKIVTDEDESWIVKDVDLCDLTDITFKMRSGKIVYSRE
jgi:hypothetical protein